MEKIGEAAKHSQVERSNLITLCGIAALYGNRNAFDVLKPKPPVSNKAITEKRAYNAIADLMTIPRMAELKHSYKMIDPNTRIIFKTLDSGLQEFTKEIAILNHQSTSFPLHTLQETTIGVNRSLFPDLNLAEFEELKAWIGEGPEPLIVL